MLFLQNIGLTYFKNYRGRAFDFSKKIVGICGYNGTGKSNLLDAIYLCCFTKSYFTSSDVLNTFFGETGFRLQAEIAIDNNPHTITCVYRGNKKEFGIDGVLYEKLSKHIGKFPAVIVAPDDIEIVNGSAELRRKYIDAILCQTDADYLQQLMVYNKLVQQRNGLLKQSNLSGAIDVQLLDTYDEQLIAPANYIFESRKALLINIEAVAKEFYNRISENKDNIQIRYTSPLFDGQFANLLRRNRDRDRFLQRTSVGVHKDDILMELLGQPFKSVASQGQKKSLLFALKFAEFEILRVAKGFSPLLLLDDVFEKLDDRRMDAMLQWVCSDATGQVFITDTHQERLSAALKLHNADFEIVVPAGH